ncbi:MAG: FtsQ-type POTRA domain-containing protein [Candidatus Binatia bacterium]|jgi:cell division septal protein FtsQ|nr:FtsQ-type POTRA domain-containing protein [Candidatus Binatia bacterium]
MGKLRFRASLWVTGVMLLLLGLFFFLHRSEIYRVIHRIKITLVTHPYFSVREMKVLGGRKVGGAEVIAMAGLWRGMNIWRVSPESIETKVKKHPWVKKVLVRREYPRRVVIEIEEWEPKGIVVLGKLYYASADGTVFKEVGENENADLPMITGIQKSDIVSQAHSTKPRLAEALRLGGHLEKSPNRLSEIHFNQGGEVVLYPISYPIAFHMGWGDWSNKVRRLRRVLSEWNGKEKHLDSLDLSFRSQVVARLREGI